MRGLAGRHAWPTRPISFQLAINADNVAIAMNVPLRAPASAPRRSWPVLLVQLAIVLVVAAVAAATFVLSYAGVHAIALQSTVPSELARVYPAVFDAVLVIACLAVPALREARWWTRWYTWLVILVIVGVLGAMDAVHAMNVALPRRDTAGVIAVLPWVLLLLAFSLWLAVLRHFRGQQSRPAAWNGGEVAAADGAAEPAASIVPLALPAPAVAAAPSEAASAREPTAAPEVPSLAAASEPAGATKAAAPDEEAAASEPGRQALQQLAEGPPPGDAPQAPGERLQPDGPASGAPAEDAAPPGHASADGPEPTRLDLPALPAAGPPPVLPAGPAAVPPAAQEPDFAAESPLEALLNGRRADAEERSDDDASVPGIAYSTGPRLRRVRSLPAPPVADE